MSKTILTTGAGSGFGKAAAIGMAKNGHTIIATTHVSRRSRRCARKPRRSAWTTSASSGST